MNNEPEKKYYIAKTLALANYLTHRGYDIVNLVPAASDPKYMVFIFVRSEQLLQEVENFYKLRA